MRLSGAGLKPEGGAWARVFPWKSVVPCFSGRLNKDGKDLQNCQAEASSILSNYCQRGMRKLSPTCLKVSTETQTGGGEKCGDSGDFLQLQLSVKTIPPLL